MVLQSIRERLTGILAFVILGILVIPFAFVGVNSYFQSGSINTVALVNEQEITFTDFNQSFLNFRRRMQSVMGAAYDPEQYDTLVARREHLDSMIDQALLADAAESMGLDVDDERLAEQIRTIPSFQVDGIFNADVYQARLQSQGMSVPQFENEMRTSIILSQLPSSVSTSSFATNTELDEFISLVDQTRSFRAMVIAADEAQVSADYSDEEISAWYNEHQLDFQTEESVAIEYLELDAAFMLTAEEPDEDFLRGRFEEQKGRFLAPEKRLVSHVLIEVSPEADEATRETARQAAEDVAKRARDGEDFAALATELSNDAGSAPTGGDLGWVEPGVMVEAFETAMYELTLESPISDPVQTGFGWHIIQLREIQESAGMEFEEARELLVGEFMEEESEREFLDLADRMVDVIYEDPTTLEAAALDLGLEVQTAGPFSRTGGDGIAANQAVVSAAFSDLVLLQGSVSDPVDLDANHMVMLRVSEHLPVATRPLEEVSDEIVAAKRAKDALDQARMDAEANLELIQAETSTLEERAAGSGLDLVVVEDGLRRSAEPDGVVVGNVFKLAVPAEGESLYAVVEAANGFAVVGLDNVTDGALEEGSVLGELQYRRQLANANASSEAWALVRQLREEAEIQVFEENLGVSR